ncbi:flagellar protein FliS [Alphaproteobacteria bacterium]|nr:flagellar protein FliS [Alphaproteobacteria bacterium]
MNYNASMKQYINDEISAKTSSLNPHKIIEEVLLDLKKNMETLAYSLDHEPVVSSIKSNSFSKSLTAIYILQSSLNFEEGKEIAENLYNIYEFCKNGIMKGFTKKDSKLVYDAIPPIDEILDGWKQIK